MEQEEEAAQKAAELRADMDQAVQHEQSFAAQLMRPAHLDYIALKELPHPSHHALGLLRHSNPLRVLCRTVYIDARFGNAILALILGNCLLLAISFATKCEPGGPDGIPPREKHPCGLGDVGYWLDMAFTIAFTVEMAIKVVALGFVAHKKSYLRSYWNMLDFVIVLSSYPIPIPYSNAGKVLRLLRVLRPLRTMSRVAGLRTLMAALFGAMPEIRDNIVLLAFLNLIFAILGVQLFKGKLHSRCIVGIPGEPLRLLAGIDSHCGGTITCSDYVENSSLLPYVYCGSDLDIEPPFGGDDLSQDPLDFDNLASSLLLVFKIFTGDDWPDDMAKLQNSYGHAAFVYFFFCITVGGLFATNLFLAVLISAYYLNKGKLENTREQALNEVWTTQSATIPRTPKGDRLENRQPTDGSDGQKRAEVELQVEMEQVQVQRKDPPVGRQAGDATPQVGLPPKMKIDSVGSHAEEDHDRIRDGDLAHKAALPANLPDIVQPSSAAASPAGDRTEGEGGGQLPNVPNGSEERPAPPAITGPGSVCLSDRPLSPKLTKPVTSRNRLSFNDQQGMDGSGSLNHDNRPTTTGSRRQSNTSTGQALSTHQAKKHHRRPTFNCPKGEELEGDEMASSGKPCDRRSSDAPMTPHPPRPPQPVRGFDHPPEQLGGLAALQKKVELFVMARNTQNFIMSVTVFNVLVLAVDHYQIDEGFLNVLNWVNLACTVVFGIEIMVKTFGLGPKRTYLDFSQGSGWNCFDLFLVIIAIPDHIAGGSSSFTAFRSFRLMKLVRRFPSVATLLSALIGCLSEGIYVSLLLCLLIFIFSILGMLFFEAEFPAEPEYFRQNFNSLWEAMLTCFIIITADSWVGTMKQGMINTSPFAFLYFFILFLLGNFVLVNVFVAVILDKLDQATSEQERLDAVLKITGTAGGSCDGVYRPVLDGDIAPLWMRKGPQEGEDARYLLSSQGDDPYWVVWKAQSREPHEGFIVSEVFYEEQMPHEISLWRQSLEAEDWDEQIRIEEIDDPDDETECAHDDVGDQIAAICTSYRVFVPLACGGVTDAAGIGLDNNLRVLEVLENGPADKECLPRGLVLQKVGLRTVLSLTDANEAYKDECRLQESKEVKEEILLVFDVLTSDLLQWDDIDEPVTVSFWSELFKKRDVTLYGRGCLPASLRRKLSYLVHSTAFDLFIIAVIAANVGFLALESGHPSDNMKTALDISNYFFTGIFTVEMLLKIAVMGLWSEDSGNEKWSVQGVQGGPSCGAYLRDPWNCLDGFVVVTALAGLVPGADALKAFRSLRTMRLVIRSQQLRIVIIALVKTVPALGVGLAVCGFIFFVFAILGLSYFKGAFYTCDGGNVTGYVGDLVRAGELGVGDTHPTYMMDRPACDKYGGEWVRATNAADHFDNIGNSLLTLFVVAIGEGWSPILFMAVDARGIDKSPKINAHIEWSLFFVVFHVVGNFFCLNLVIGILISEFTNWRRELDGTQGMHLSELQQSYIHAEKAVLLKLMFKELPGAPEKDFGGIRKRCFDAVQHRNFDRAVTLVIIASMIIFATVFYPQDNNWETFQYWGNRVCSIIFIAEAAIKILGLGARSYFRENWNRFDFVIVLVSILDIANVQGLSGLSAVRVLRVGRLFRLVGKAKGLQKLFNTMFQGDNLYYFGNIGCFCIAIIFMFAVAGVSLFGTIDRAQAVDHNLNFENVGFAMITLFTISTTEAWLSIRDGLMESNVVSGHIFALLWIVVGSVVLLNLFAAVVVELFDKQSQLEAVSKNILAVEGFRDRWRDRFGRSRTEVSVEEFIEGLKDSDKVVEVPGEEPVIETGGLLPSKLRAIPKPLYDVGGGKTLGNVYLPRHPNNLQLLAYLTALGLPLRKRGLQAVVTYRDAVFCYAARSFGLQQFAVDEVHANKLTRAPKCSANCFLSAHWFASNILATNIKRSISRKRGGAPDAETAGGTNE
eukprot:Hpha_TRINITY_DN15786_c1_g2::TRINITY_DN15786_c1_g2_i1::g.37396::m.37396/K04834/SCN2A; voltage-gated sodium channel type II alpha